MNAMKPIILCITGVLYASVAWSAIYQSRDADGNLVFSDEPADGAKQVELPPLPTYTAPKLAQPVSDEQEAADKLPGLYQNLEIISPRPDEAVRENAGNITIQAKLTPELKRSSRHKFQFFLDGQPVGPAAPAPQVMLTNVDRGTHNVDVAVVDDSGKEFIRSKPVEFHMMRVTARPRIVPR